MLLGYLILLPWGYVAGAFGDDGLYLALGRALAEGEGYRSIYYPGSPLQTKYPPLLPSIYALLWGIGGSLVFVESAVRTLNALLVAPAAGAIWWVGRRQMGVRVVPLGALAIGPLFLVEALRLNRAALSEPLSLLLWAAAVALGCRLAFANRAMNMHAVLLGMVLALALATRTQAVMLVPGVLIGLHLRRVPRRALAIVAVLPAASVLAWTIFQLWHPYTGPALPDEGSYLSWIPHETPLHFLAFIIGQPLLGALGHGWWLANVLAPAWLGLLVLAVALAFFGLGIPTAGEEPVVWLATGSLLLSVLAWPWVHIRLLLPLLPFLGLVAASGYTRWADHARRPALPRLLLGCAAAIVLVSQLLRFPSTTGVMHGDWGDFIEESAPWIRANAAATDVLLAPSPGGVYLHTDRKTVNAAPAEPHTAASVFDTPGRFYAQRIVADSVDIVVLPEGTRWAEQARALADACPAELLQLESRPGILAYRVGAGGCVEKRATAVIAVPGGQRAQKGVRWVRRVPASLS